ncbi:MAG: DUF2599 domain-containing protein [Actinomycetaceae bacterium]|nr:DUF2599 domain-containing protein [Actinomycetaceae bacterium]
MRRFKSSVGKGGRGRTLALFAILMLVHMGPASADQRYAPVASSADSALTVLSTDEQPQARIESWMRTDLFFERVTITRKEEGFVVNAMPTEFGKSVVRNRGTWFLQELEVRAKAGVGDEGQPYWNESIANQLTCHLAGYPFSLPEYNLESWRPSVEPYVSLVTYQCNPR